MKIRGLMLFAGVSTAALSCVPAAAQTAALPREVTPVKDGVKDGGGEESGDIVVTARRVNESLSQVPASITAFNAATIEKASIERAQDFVKLTPGVTLVSSTAETAAG